MDSIVQNHPQNLAVKHFNEKSYKKYADDHQHAFMRCIEPAVRYPAIEFGCYAHSAGDYQDFHPFFANVIADYCP
jgi:hypothetical protein